MKMMFKIAKTKLQSLFYSPIAWLLLVVFAYQVGMIMSGMLEDIVVRQAMGYESWKITTIFGDLFKNVQGTLYFYIPLLTMNMISRDLSGGTIKLLQSAPLRNAEIVLGKYLALMIFGLAMMGVLLFYVLFGVCTIQNIDFPYVLTGMLGLYLLLCAYAAIGLFVSSLTSYQVMAAFGTLFILAMFNYVGGVSFPVTRITTRVISGNMFALNRKLRWNTCTIMTRFKTRGEEDFYPIFRWKKEPDRLHTCIKSSFRGI